MTRTAHRRDQESFDRRAIDLTVEVKAATGAAVERPMAVRLTAVSVFRGQGSLPDTSNTHIMAESGSIAEWLGGQRNH